MRRLVAAVMLLMVFTLPSIAAKKDTGTTALKDLQPAGTTDSKNKKKQQFDFIFTASGHEYTCRTSPKTKVNATDFVVGRDVQYEINGDKGTLKNTSGKEVKCTVVRVEAPKP